MKCVPQITTLTLAMLFAGSAVAGTPVGNGKPGARAAELAAAQADLQRAARRVAELSQAMAPSPGEIVRQRLVRKPVVGVVLAPDALAGVRIVAVTPRSGAAKAGLRGGDRLIAIDGRELAGTDDAARVEKARALLDDLDTKTPVRLVYLRNGRKATVSVLPSLSADTPAFAWVDTNGELSQAFGDVLFTGPDGSGDVIARAFQVTPPGISAQVQREIARIRPAEACGDDCGLPLLAEAFRWNGLNLAAVDPQLGRYFGTSSGVLVLSAGDSLAGLQPGDVLRRIDGRSVASPRDAMAALRAHAAGSRVSVDYLRDHKPATTQVTVPKAFLWSVPPAPPRPPQPPAPPPPPAPPAAGLDELPAMPDMPALAALTPSAPAPVVAVEPGDVIGLDDL